MPIIFDHTGSSAVSVSTNASGLTVGGVNILTANDKGAVSGVATLDSSGKVPSSQLPSYVDDVLEYANLADFPATGSAGIIYVALDTNKTYRWSGSTYVNIAQTDWTVPGAIGSVTPNTAIFTSITNTTAITATPTYTPAIDGSANIVNIAMNGKASRYDSYGFGSGGNNIRFRYAGGTAAAPTYPNALTALGTITPQGWDEATSSYANAGAIAFHTDAQWSSTVHDTRIEFYTVKGTTGAERMRVNSNGNVLIGTTTDTGKRLNVNGGVHISDESTVSSAFSLTSNEGPDTGSTKLKFGYEGIGGGPDQIATSVVVEFNQTTAPDTLTEGGLIVKNNETTDVTSNYSQLTSKKLVIGGKADDISGAGGTVSSVLQIDLSDPLEDASGIGSTYISGGVVFNQVTDVPSGMELDKSYRFKGNARDVMIRDGINFFNAGSTHYTRIEGKYSLTSNTVLTLPEKNGTIAVTSDVDSRISDNLSVTVATASTTNLDSLDITKYRTVKYIVQLTAGASYQSEEILMMHNGTNVFMSESNSIVTATSLGTFDATITGGNMVLTVTTNQASTVAKLVRIPVTV